MWESPTCFIAIKYNYESIMKRSVENIEINRNYYIVYLTSNRYYYH